MTITYCDRCTSTDRIKSVKVTQETYTEKSLDLCVLCRESLTKFLQPIAKVAVVDTPRV
jgi:hypothetical protein